MKDATAEDLRAMGISFAKAASILRLARSIIDGDMDESELSAMDNESAIAGLSTLRERDRKNERSAQLDHDIKARRDSSTKARRVKQTTNMIESDATHARPRLSKRRKPDDQSSVTDAAQATQLSPRQALIRNGKKR